MRAIALEMAMKKLMLLLLFTCLSLMEVRLALAVTIEEWVSSGNDDAEEVVSSGDMDRSSSDLELIEESSEQLVGIRFRYVQVPQGATITNAYIEFETDEVSSGTTNLSIRAEASNWAQSFGSSRGDISDRTLTATSVAWNGVAAWNSVSAKHQTVELKALVQEVVSREGWSMGNPLVFVFSGSGTRVAESYDGESGNAPLLHVEYTPKADSLDIRVSSNQDDAEESGSGSMSLYSSDLEMVTEATDQKIGLRFTGVDLAPGATISKAYLDFATDERSTSNPNGNNLVIRGEAAASASAFSTGDYNIVSRTPTSSSVDWSKVPKWQLVGEKQRSPDISAIVQEIIGGSGWLSGNSMAFIVYGEGKRVAESYDGDNEAAPLLHIEYAGGSLPYLTVDVASSEEISVGAVSYEEANAVPDSLTITNSGSATLDYTLAVDAVWLSLSPASGRLDAGESASVAITFSSSTLAVGTYETSITVSGAGATNSPVEIPVSLTVQAVPVITTCGNLPPYAANQVSPAVLVELDVSSSMENMMSISNAADNPKSPDLSTLVQEIVNRAGWASGNSMVFIIEGSGKRVADSYDGNTGTAPLLHIGYDFDGSSAVIDLRVRQSSDDAEDRSGSTSLTSSDLELINDSSDQVVGIRFQDLAIPVGVTITAAYLEFVIDEATSEATSLIISGQADDNPATFTRTDGSVTGRTKTDASVVWNAIAEWSAPTEMSRIEIGKSAIGDLVKDRTIDWGYGTWAFSGYDEDDDFTKIHVGTKSHDDAQQAALQAAISATHSTSGTPFGPSIVAARKYYAGEKKDQDGAGDNFVDIGCQDKFLIDVTDGLGYSPHTTVDLVEDYTHALCDSGVTPIAVGFGIDDASQLYKMAEIANACGNLDDDDNLFALHDEIGGVAQPFIASSKDELVEALSTISKKISNRFTGSAPAPTTSADDQDLTLVIVSEFKSADWSGDVTAYSLNSDTGAYDQEVWVVTDEMPVTASRNVRTVDGSGNLVVYDDALLAGDNWLCKPLGDIINSTPKIVKSPAFYYGFDNYSDFYSEKEDRDPMVYVGANDGALHAFHLVDKTEGTVADAGTESWAFVPHSLQYKLNLATSDPSLDMCSDDYCHLYFVDGNPIAADIYADGAWQTILVSGLREGGESYFALDVTSGLPLGTAGGASYKWEFSDPDLGQSWADPSIDRVTSGTGKTWAVYLSSGYSPTDRSLDEAYLYGLLADDMAPLWEDASNNPISKWKLSTKLANALAAPLSLDLDLDTDFASDHIYTGDLYGSFYRVQNIGEDETPAVSQLLNLGNTTHANPIRGQADFAYSETIKEVWLYFGSGRYEDARDKLNNARQYFFGLKDTPDNDAAYPDSYVVTPSELNAVSINLAADNLVSGASLSESIIVLDARTLSDAESSNRYRVIDGLNSLKRSWVLRLIAAGSDGAERVTSQPLVVGGMVFFTAFTPSSDACSGSGTTWLYALQYDSGLGPDEPVFDIDGNGRVDADDMISVDGEKVPPAGVLIGKGQGARPVVHGETIFTTTSEGGLKATKVSLPLTRAEVRGWRDLGF